MTPSFPVTPTSGPHIVENEDGDVFWFAGHDVSEPDARETLRSHLAYRWGGDLSERAAKIAATSATFERVWFRFADPENDDEYMVRCEQTDDNAEPFTQMEADL